MSVLTNPITPAVVAAALVALGTVRAWFYHRSTVIRERAQTERLQAALDGTDPKIRPDVLRACNGLHSPLAIQSDSEPDPESGEKPQ